MNETLRILLLEDQAFDAELLQELLKRSYPTAELVWVTDAASFFQALKGPAFDIILSDHQLPGFSGTEALDHVRQQDALVPFIFVSGVIGEDNAVDMLKRGATDYVIKGRLSRLPVVIDRALEEVRQRQARQVAEAQLREADALYARVVDSLRDYAVILLDKAGLIRSWNRAAQSIFGHSSEQAIGQSIEIIFMPEDRAAKVHEQSLARALQEGGVQSECWLLHADGTPLRGEGVVTPLFNADGTHTGYSKLIHDSTAAWKDAQALRQAKEEAERANSAKDRFLAVLSHELRTPLTPITAAVHLLERQGNLPQEVNRLLPMIRRNIALEARLIDDLLDLTAIGAGKVNLQIQTVDLHALVVAVMEMLKDDIAAKHLQLELSLDADCSEVDGDEARLQQVLWNIVRNAIKFTPEGGRIRIASTCEGQEVVLSCSDNGIGIHPDALPRIFLPFEQADADVSRRFGGLGLGLAIASGLVTHHRGRLTVDSEGRDKGALFTLRMPMALQRTQAALPELPSAGTAPEVRRVKLLLVEDNLDTAEAMGMSLEDLGYEVTHAYLLQEAFAAAERERFDVIVTDLGLPDGSGVEIGRRLHDSLPVLAVSGFGSPNDLKESKEAGFVAHLVKPVDPLVVHEAVQSALA